MCCGSEDTRRRFRWGGLRCGVVCALNVEVEARFGGNGIGSASSPRPRDFVDSIDHRSCTITTTSPPDLSHRYSIPISSKMAQQALGSIYKWAIPATAAFSLASASIYDVKGGTRAVIFDRLRGVSDQVMNEGTHFLVPWLQKSITFDVRTRPRNISTTTGSKDMQMVSLTLRVLHRPEVQQLPKIYQVRMR